MDNYLYKIEHEISLDDFKEFNQKIAIKYLDKSKKKSKIIGFIEIFSGLLYLIMSFIKYQTIKIDIYFFLSISIIIMGLFSITYYSLIFEKQLNKNIEKIYNQNEYFFSKIILLFFDDHCIEKVFLKEKIVENTKYYDTFIDVQQTENIVSILFTQTSGFIIPKRYIDENIKNDFLEFLKSKIKIKKV